MYRVPAPAHIFRLMTPIFSRGTNHAFPLSLRRAVYDPLQPAQLLLLRVAPSPMRVQAAALRAVWMTAAVTAANARGSSGPRSSAGVGGASSAFVGCAAAIMAPPEAFCECLDLSRYVLLPEVVVSTPDVVCMLLVCKVCAERRRGGGGEGGVS